MTVSDKQGNKAHMNILITEVFLRPQAKRQTETDWRRGVVTKIDHSLLNKLLSNLS